MHWRPARRAGRRAVGLALAAVVSVAGCAARAPRAGGPPLPAGVLPTGAPGWRLDVVAACELVADPAAGASGRVGGLSGLLLEPDAGTYLAVSDQEVPRVYRLRLDVDGPSCRPAVLDTILLRWPDAAAPAAGARDFEDLAWWPGGDLLLVSEREAGRGGDSLPGLHRFTAAGLHVQSLPVPARLRPGPGVGVRPNAAFESVTTSPDGARAFVAVEQPLVQDDEPPTFARGGASRLIEYRRTGDGYAPAREFALPVEPVPHPGAIAPRRADLGVVALAALEDGSLLVLERSFVAGTRDGRWAGRNDILLSRLVLDEADDVSGVESLKGSLARPVAKQRLLSLRDVAAQLPPWLATLDNFEGMALGPRAADGRRTLVLVSDDNFNAAQRTAFIVLRLAPGAAGRADAGTGDRSR